MATKELTYDSDEVTKLDILMAMIEGSGDVEYQGAVKTVSVRMELFELANVDALAQLAGKSRNVMINRLIEAALEMVWSTASKATQKQISAARKEHMQALLETAESSSGE